MCNDDEDYGDGIVSLFCSSCGTGNIFGIFVYGHLTGMHFATRGFTDVYYEFH